MAITFPQAGFIVPAFLVMIEVLLDNFTTGTALAMGITEKNPVSLMLMSSFSLTGYMILKFCIVLGLVAAMVFIAHRRRGTKTHQYICFGLWFLCAVYLYVVLSNLEAIM